MSLLGRVSRGTFGPHQTAVVRIGIAGTWLAYLLWEWPNRHELFGPDAPLSWPLAERAAASNGAFSVLLWSPGVLWFEAAYLFAIAAAVAMLLGWRTRTATVLFMIGVLSVQNRNSFVNNGGDNVIHLMSIYLTFTRCGQVWSLDARRAHRQGTDFAGPGLWAVLGAALLTVSLAGHLSPGWTVVFASLWLGHGVVWAVRRGEPRAVLDMIANLVHNAALLVIMVQICLLYVTAGLLKTQGSRWQDGTAVYYSTQIDDFAVWPALSDLLASNALVVLMLTYATMIIQVAFPVSLINRRVKNVLLACLIAEHIGIAVLLGLPFFSLAVIAVDLIFLPTGFLLWSRHWLRTRLRISSDALRGVDARC